MSNQDQQPRSNRTALKVVAIVAGAIVVAMGFSNPPRDKYVDYAAQKLSDQMKEAICPPVNQANQDSPLGELSDLVAGICTAGINLQRGKVKDFVDGATDRQNLLIFSIYRTETPKHEYVTLAIAGNFIALNY
jgi:hypothetical protein